MTRASWYSALKGFLVCAVLTFGVCGWLYLAAPDLADTLSQKYTTTSSGAAAETHRWLLHHMRRIARHLGLLFLSASTIYWLVAAMLGKGPVASILSANVLLFLAATCLLGALLNQYYGWAETFCDQLPYSHQGFEITRLNECPSSAIFFSALELMSGLLLLASLVISVRLSRRTA